MSGLTMDQLALLSLVPLTVLALLVIYFTQACCEPVSKKALHLPRCLRRRACDALSREWKSRLTS